MSKYIKQEQLLKNEKLQKEILGKIQNWYQDSETYMSQKRELFKYRYSKFTNPADSETDKIKIHLLFQHLKAFISTYYTDWLTAWFVWAEFLDDDYAYMLETCYKKDTVTMKKKQKDFFHIMNIGFYGVSLLMKEWYDTINQTIKYSVVSPEYWLPDPHGSTLKGFRYHMFDFSITKNEITKINKLSKSWDIYFNIDDYTKTRNDSTDNWDEKKEDRALGTAIVNEQYEGTRIFFEREWVKYLADLFNDRKTIGRRERITPISEEEKKHPELVPFPVVVVNAFPLEDDPCGIWLAELVLSFQNAKNRLMNMALRKEERNSGFQVLLADISKITDIDLLAERPTDWPIIVPFNWEMWKLDGDVVRPVIDGIKADQSTLNLSTILDQEAQGNTWYTASQRWLPTWPDVSLWEAKMQQVNSNLIFSLDSECIGWWEVSFVKDMWLRGLKEYLPEHEVKYARIGNGIASNEVMINGKDIKDHWDPDIFVESKKEIGEKNKKKLDYLMAREAFVMANPDIPAISKLFYQRDIEKYRGIPREEIYLKYPRTSDENRAIRYIKQLNAYAEHKDNKKITEDLKPKALFYPWMDLRTYYIYLQKARESDVKKDVLAKINDLMIEEWLNKAKQPPQPWQEGGGEDKMAQVGNSMASQLTSNIAQQSGSVNNYPTRADVLSP